MRLQVSYRPLSGCLFVIDADVDEKFLNGDDVDIDYTHDNDEDEDEDEDEWNVCLGMYGDEFHSFVVLGVRTVVPYWNLWLSFYLPDAVVAQIAHAIIRWDAEQNERADCRSMATRQITIKV